MTVNDVLREHYIKSISFQISAEYCQLCKLISGHFENIERDPLALPKAKQLPYSIEILTTTSCRITDTNRVSGCTLSLFPYVEVNLAIWADEGESTILNYSSTNK
jgi:hypothetical protein